MSTDYLPLEGDSIGGDALVIRRAAELYVSLIAGGSPYARFVAALRGDADTECVIFDLDVEVGQEPLNDVRKCERIAVVCARADDTYPEVLALRSDFPRVPHINLRVEEFPRSLCLYEEAWHEVKLRWTAPGFVERIRRWLALTSDGVLHGRDQPLEPILLGPFRHLVLPGGLFTAERTERPERLSIFRCTDDPKDTVLIAMRPGGTRTRQPAFAASVFHAKPQEHGVIHRQPRTLAELHDLMSPAGVDFLPELRTRLRSWDLDAALKNSPLVIIAFFPKTRTRLGPIEAHDVWAFSTNKTTAEVGQSVGLWDLRDGQIGAIIGGVDKRGDDVLVEVLNPTFAFSRARAAILNGLPEGDSRRIVAIGAGALGSQVLIKLVRAGFGRWTIVDDDVFLPHNLARHELLASDVGLRKAEMLALRANSVLEEDGVAVALTTNVLYPGDQAQALEAALREAELIVDFSASVAVGRRLSAHKGATARRLSLFLNPRGTDLVVLAEDIQRTVPLNYLEMIYYREVANSPMLETHLRTEDGPVRYAQSCRDITSTVPEDLVGLHSAIGSRALRAAAASETASIRVWQAQPDLTVSLVNVVAPDPISASFGEWTLYTDARLLKKIGGFRGVKLPNETGGVLIGHFDTDNRVVYVVDALPSPPDSKEWPTVYIRGATGLRERVEQIRTITSTMLEYVGEWHSHPDGYSCRPSGDDKKAFAYLTRSMQIDGFPAIMLIAGQEDCAWYLGIML